VQWPRAAPHDTRAGGVTRRRCVSFDHGDDANGDLDLEVSLCLDLDREKDLDASPQHVSATFSFDVDA